MNTQQNSKLWTYQKSRWSSNDDRLLREAVVRHGASNWKAIASSLNNTKTDTQCFHRWEKVIKPGLTKGPWTTEEDAVVIQMVQEIGPTKWSYIASKLPGRLGKQCRERWMNHLDPKLIKGQWTKKEDYLLLALQQKLGNRWCEIAKYIVGRSENAIKNRWNSHLRKMNQANNAVATQPKRKPKIKDISKPKFPATQSEHRVECVCAHQHPITSYYTIYAPPSPSFFSPMPPSISPIHSNPNLPNPSSSYPLKLPSLHTSLRNLNY